MGKNDLKNDAKELAKSAGSLVGSLGKTARDYIFGKKDEETGEQTPGALDSIKNTCQNISSSVIEKVEEAKEKSDPEMRNANLALFDMNKVMFFKDTANANSTVFQPGTIFNSEIMVLQHMGESDNNKKYIAMPNFLFSYGLILPVFLEMWENVFDFEYPEDLNEDTELIITEIFPAKFKTISENPNYILLLKKGKIVLDYLVEKNDNDSVEITEISEDVINSEATEETTESSEESSEDPFEDIVEPVEDSSKKETESFEDPSEDPFEDIVEPVEDSSEKTTETIENVSEVSTDIT